LKQNKKEIIVKLSDVEDFLLWRDDKSIKIVEEINVCIREIDDIKERFESIKKALKKDKTGG
jgi:hypothetical protein